MEGGGGGAYLRGAGLNSFKELTFSFYKELSTQGQGCGGRSKILKLIVK